MCACTIPVNASYVPKEQPHLYWKDIDVIVTSVDQRTWFATVHRRILYITVESEEYGLVKSFTFESSGMINTINCWDCKVGDVVKAELYSWVMDSTGEVVRRDINKLY
jgi:hypothetical protein